MGMFDTFFFAPQDGPLCGEGHPVVSCQTKDLDNALLNYFVIDKVAYLLGKGGKEQLEPPKYTPFYDFGVYYGYAYKDGKQVIFERKSIATPATDLTGGARIYGGCGKCEPIYYVSNDGLSFRSSLSGLSEVLERGPWLEYDITIIKGKVKKLKVIAAPTREELRIQLKKSGAEVLSDKNPIVLAHKNKYKGKLSDLDDAEWRE